MDLLPVKKPCGRLVVWCGVTFVILASMVVGSALVTQYGNPLEWICTTYRNHRAYRTWIERCVRKHERVPAQLRESAESGCAESQYGLGWRLLAGYVLGWEMDDGGAVVWLRKAAEQGHSRAQFELARCYEKGIGVKQDYKEAIKWFNEVIIHGRAPRELSCSTRLRKYHRNDIDGFKKKDLEKVVECYRIMAERRIWRRSDVDECCRIRKEYCTWQDDVLCD